MTRLLVPVDLSPASLNAAEYGIQLAANFDKAELVLFHVFAPTGVGVDGSPIAGHDKTEHDQVVHILEGIQVAIYGQQPRVPTDIRVMRGDFIEELKVLLSNERFDFIVMGIAQVSKVEQKIMSSSVFNVIDSQKLPALIIMDEVTYKPIKHAALAADLHHAHETVDFERISALLHVLGADLHFVSVLNHHPDSALTEHEGQVLNELQSHFMEFHPKHTFLQNKTFVEAMNNFSEENHIDLMVILPRKHNFFQRLLGVSNTSNLVFSGNLPILACRY